MITNATGINKHANMQSTLSSEEVISGSRPGQCTLELSIHHTTPGSIQFYRGKGELYYLQKLSEQRSIKKLLFGFYIIFFKSSTACQYKAYRSYGHHALLCPVATSVNPQTSIQWVASGPEAREPPPLLGITPIPHWMTVLCGGLWQRLKAVPQARQKSSRRVSTRHCNI